MQLKGLDVSCHMNTEVIQQDLDCLLNRHCAICNMLPISPDKQDSQQHAVSNKNAKNKTHCSTQQQVALCPACRLLPGWQVLLYLSSHQGWCCLSCRGVSLPTRLQVCPLDCGGLACSLCSALILTPHFTTDGVLDANVPMVPCCNFSTYLLGQLVCSPVQKSLHKSHTA